MMFQQRFRQVVLVIAPLLAAAMDDDAAQCRLLQLTFLHALACFVKTSPVMARMLLSTGAGAVEDFLTQQQLPTDDWAAQLAAAEQPDWCDQATTAGIVLPSLLQLYDAAIVTRPAVQPPAEPSGAPSGPAETLARVAGQDVLAKVGTMAEHKNATELLLGITLSEAQKRVGEAYQRTLPGFERERQRLQALLDSQTNLDRVQRQAIKTLINTPKKVTELAELKQLFFKNRCRQEGWKLDLGAIRTLHDILKSLSANVYNAEAADHAEGNDQLLNHAAKHFINHETKRVLRDLSVATELSTLLIQSVRNMPGAIERDAERLLARAFAGLIKDNLAGQTRLDVLFHRPCALPLLQPVQDSLLQAQLLIQLHNQPAALLEQLDQYFAGQRAAPSRDVHPQHWAHICSKLKATVHAWVCLERPEALTLAWVVEAHNTAGPAAPNATPAADAPSNSSSNGNDGSNSSSGGGAAGDSGAASRADPPKTAPDANTAAASTAPTPEAPAPQPKAKTPMSMQDEMQKKLRERRERAETRTTQPAGNPATSSGGGDDGDSSSAARAGPPTTAPKPTPAAASAPAAPTPEANTEAPARQPKAKTPMTMQDEMKKKLQDWRERAKQPANEEPQKPRASEPQKPDFIATVNGLIDERRPYIDPDPTDSDPEEWLDENNDE